jgi:hypothetical protein
VYHKLTLKGDFIKRGEISYGSHQEDASYTHTNPAPFSLDTSSPHSLYQVKVVDEATKDTVLSSVKSVCGNCSFLKQTSKYDWSALIAYCLISANWQRLALRISLSSMSMKAVILPMLTITVSSVIALTELR